MSELTDRRQDGEAPLRDEPARSPLAEEAVESVAAWLAAIAEPTRIRLMEILNGGTASVAGLAAQLGTSHQNASRHLGVLRQAGIVARRKAGNRVHYELADFSGWWVVEQAASNLTAQP
ncbi:MAG TPA: metalloregulator ArsR/SmtB family transcription factor [Solirubrobacterales bacterium]|nr:metalloregulator ArsR/SmtB family transcription factor [Solirubrobacterales bacterium]